MKEKQKPNIVLLVSIVLLVVVGILALVTASVPLSLKITGNANYYLVHQILWGLLPGLVFGFIAYRFPLQSLKKYSFLIFLISYILMLLVFVPALNRSALGASRWLDIGIISFQPSDILKLATIIYLSVILTSDKTKKKFATFIVILALICLALILQSDMGTLIAIFAVAIIMFFCSKTPLKQTLAIGFSTVVAFVALILLTPYRMQRLMSFLHPETDPLGTGYHINQTLIAIGSGGLFGSGLGFSVQKFGFVPQSMSDSIFAIFAEETGFAGGLLLIALFSIFFFSAFSVAKRINDDFLRMLAIGIGSWIIFQAFVNIGAMTAIVPLTGIPLPFVSYGGSHLILELVGCGILLNISKQVKPVKR
jgi:cell division protein FtsW